MSREERKAMIAPSQRPSLSRQCDLMSISRSSFYYTPRGESAKNLALMRRIDELFLRCPFYGSRQMVRQLRREGLAVGRHRVRRLMRRMGDCEEFRVRAGITGKKENPHAPPQRTEYPRRAD